VIINTDLNLRWISLAIAEIAPSALAYVEQLENGVQISSETDLPTEANIVAKAEELSDEYANNQYSRNRAGAYPSIQEQLDMQYWDSVNGTTTWADAIAAVKEANPKPE
jgi:glutamine synthetase type III